MLAIINLLLAFLCLFAGWPVLFAGCLMAAVGCWIIDIAEARDIARYERRKIARLSR